MRHSSNSLLPNARAAGVQSVTRPRPWRVFASLGALSGAVLALSTVAGGQAGPGARTWVGSWAASASSRVEAPTSLRVTPSRVAVPSPTAVEDPVPVLVARVAPAQQLRQAGESPAPVFGRTLRQVVHLSLGGPRLRVVLTNAFGNAPLVIGTAHVGLREGDFGIAGGTLRPLTFAGQTQATIAEGAVVISDPVALTTPDFADVVIDLFVEEPTTAMLSPVTLHAASWQTNLISPAGNFSGAAKFPVELTTAYRRSDGLASASSFFLARVEVDAPAGTGAIVTLGDSITDGTHSGMDANNRWPDHLARRLVAGGVRMGVLNAGIGGNRLLRDGNGPNALARFDRDVLAQTGVTHVVVLEGINDIGQGRERPEPSVADLIAGHRQLIERAHARGLKIYGATLTPFEGANYWTKEGEAKRQALNEWIRTGKAYDAVLDFDAVIRDPAQPTRAKRQFDPGDHLHLTAAGYQAVAAAIDLNLFRGVR